MKVRITTTVEIDPQAWALDYGIRIKQVHKDVQEWAEYLIAETLRERGMIPKTDAEVYDKWCARGGIAGEGITLDEQDAILRHVRVTSTTTV